MRFAADSARRHLRSLIRLPDEYTTLPAEGLLELIQEHQRGPGGAGSRPRRFTVDASAYASQIHAAALANNIDRADPRGITVIGLQPFRVSGPSRRLDATDAREPQRYNVTNRHDPNQNIHGGAQYPARSAAQFDTTCSLL